MAELNKCFKVHLDLSRIDDLDVFVNSVAKVADLTFDEMNGVVVWLDDDKDKKDLIRSLKKVGIKEYFCEPIEYDDIGKNREFNFVSAWFMDKYRAYMYREVEKKNQSQLREMYENIQKAQKELEIKNRDGDSLDDKQSILKEAQKGV